MRFSECASSAGSRRGSRCAAGMRCCRSARAVRCVGIQQHAKTAQLASGRRVTSHGCVVRGDRGFQIALQLGHFLADLITHLRRAASFVDLFLSAGNNSNGIEQLGIVANALSWAQRSTGTVVALDYSIIFVRRCQAIALPFVKGVFCGIPANRGHHRSFLRANHVDFVLQVFAVALGVVAVESIGRLRHFLVLLRRSLPNLRFGPRL